MTQPDILCLPPLVTLERKPSWVNRAGRVDRSACAEVRASELWRSCTNMRSARTCKGRLAVGTVNMHTIWLAAMHGDRHPFALQGDFRTAKSNAMKDPHAASNVPPSEQQWPHNPNRSASRTKLLGLWAGGEPGHEETGPWTQEIRIERWQRGPRKKNASRLPSAERRASRSRPPTYQQFLICPNCEQRFIKLFMVLCTEREAFDAELAEGWIARSEAKHRGSHTHLSREFYSMRAKLIDRYGLLFRARRLACRKCIGIRYGQVREKERRIDPYAREKMQRDLTRGYETNRPR